MSAACPAFTWLPGTQAQVPMLGQQAVPEGLSWGVRRLGLCCRGSPVTATQNIHWKGKGRSWAAAIAQGDLRLRGGGGWGHRWRTVAFAVESVWVGAHRLEVLARWAGEAMGE